MLHFDHMTMIAPSLDDGVRYVSDCLAIDLRNGARHVDMATHNRRVRLGPDCYLEVIAADPGAPAPKEPRWFGLDRVEDVCSEWSRGLRLRGWVARTDDIDAVLATHGNLLGSKRWLDDHFHFSVPADGGLPMGGVLPSVIDVGTAPPTAESLEDQGIRLRDFVLEHPDPANVVRLYEDLKIVNAPRVVSGDAIRFFAEVETPSGMRVLRCARA